MKTNELRVGNFIMYSDIKKVFDVDIWFFAELKNGISKIEEFEPIPLTEEWLVKLPNGLKYPAWINHVHDLQNWYYYNHEKKELFINQLI